MTEKPKKTVNFATARVLTWTPNEGQQHLAMFEGFPVSFSASTSEGAREKALEWRIDELDKAQRIAVNKKKAAERLKSAHAAKVADE